MSTRLPPRWRKCPRKGTLIDVGLSGKFLPFKTPLDDKFNRELKPTELFTPQMLIKSQKDANQRIGLWIDLTKTNRYYDKRMVEQAGITYCKLSCDGNEGAPTSAQVKTFIHICKKFLIKSPLEVICIHCTHGFNRTGFLICSYLIEELGWSIEAAIQEFTRSRQPGIYKQEYLNQLYQNYGDEDDRPCQAPEKPSWCFEDDDVDDDGDKLAHNNDDREQQPQTSNGRIVQNRKSEFMEGVSGVEFVNDLNKSKLLQRQIKEACAFDKAGFPGSQPVSMSRKNINKIAEGPYKVSWKADGTRYMMLVKGENEIYFFDRDNTVFQITEGCPRFPKRKEPLEHLKDTLVDGEMIIDTFKNVSTARYLIYDIITLDGNIDIGKSNFDYRTLVIENEIIKPREEAKKQGTINRDLESFGIRKKDFWDIQMTSKFFEPKFLNCLGHDIDGLIFQPVNDPYIAGQCPNILKWKPPTHNSIDFKVKIQRISERGCLPETKAHLFVGGWDMPFFTVRATKEFRESNEKIVECTFDVKTQTFNFMRVRTDKSFPNSKATADAVLETMLKPLYKEDLIDYINKFRYQERGKKRPAAN